MTCERYERDLALAVEGDLPDREHARLQEHLQQCAPCQEFLRGLKDSQRKLKALAAEPVGDAALATVRMRVTAALGERARPSWVVPARAWGLAAGVAIVALGLTMVVWRTTPTPPWQNGGFVVAVPPAARVLPVPAPVPVETPAPTAMRGFPEGPTAPPSRRRSTVRATLAVSRSMEPETARVVHELSSDDADQLARAVVAVSRIHRMRDWLPDAPAEPLLPPVVRLETSDPGVVIYWKLDSNGG